MKIACRYCNFIFGWQPWYDNQGKACCSEECADHSNKANERIERVGALRR